MCKKNVTTNGIDPRNAQVVQNFFPVIHHVDSVKKEDHVIMLSEQAFDKI